MAIGLFYVANQDNKSSLFNLFYRCSIVRNRNLSSVPTIRVVAGYVGVTHLNLVVITPWRHAYPRLPRGNQLPEGDGQPNMNGLAWRENCRRS